MRPTASAIQFFYFILLKIHNNISDPEAEGLDGNISSRITCMDLFKMKRIMAKKSVQWSHDTHDLADSIGWTLPLGGSHLGFEA